MDGLPKEKGEKSVGSDAITRKLALYKLWFGNYLVITHLLVVKRYLRCNLLIILFDYQNNALEYTLFMTEVIEYLINEIKFYKYMNTSL